LNTSTSSIVADTSYVIEGLLSNFSLIRQHENIYFLIYSVSEVINAIWKRQILLKRLSQEEANGTIAFFFRLILNDNIRLLDLEQKDFMAAYVIAAKTRLTVYDTSFIVLANKIGLELKTFDKKQARIYEQQQ
jgi:predicted nucleic acid-binding protein